MASLALSLQWLKLAARWLMAPLVARIFFPKANKIAHRFPRVHYVCGQIHSSPWYFTPLRPSLKRSRLYLGAVGPLPSSPFCSSGTFGTSS